MNNESITKEEWVVLRPSQTNDVFKDDKFDITKFISKQGKSVAYFEAKEGNKTKE